MEKTIEIPVEYKRLFDSDWREAAVYGGRYSLKSHTVARVLLIRARKAKTRIACFREYQNSIGDSSHQLLTDLIKMYGLNDFKVTDKAIINTVNGSDFLFKGLHLNEQNVKSTEGVDIAWVEEAQTVLNSSLEVLTPTIRKPGSQIIYTYNRLFEEDPVHHRLVLDGRPNTLIIHTNYHVAERHGWLPKSIKDEIESDRVSRPGLYKHKWLGEPLNQEAKIYNDWAFIDSIPEDARLERRGLDFGYSNDPTTIVDVYYLNGGFILDERLYRKGMSNKDIADWLSAYDDNNIRVYADSAEPKSIDEISSYGVNIIPAQKGSGSVSQGIQYIQDQRISVTKRSTNLIHEYRSYMWETDKEGKILNKPIDTFNHLMDALRYALESYSRNYSRDVGIVTTGLPTQKAHSWVQEEDKEGVPLAYAIDIEKAIRDSDKRERDWRYQ